MDRFGPAGGSPLVTLTNGQQGAVDENLGTGQQGTLVPAALMNGIVEEMMSILAAAGTTPDITNFGQVLAAIQWLITNSIAAYVNSSGFFYVKFALPGGGNPLIIQGRPVSLGAGVANADFLLPVAWNTGFKGAVGLDGGAAAYTYGGSASGANPLTYVTVYCPTSQLIFGSVAARGTASGYIIAWGY